jgi:signal transduction histidine kinase
MIVRSAQEALAQRPLTFLRSSWPWRSLAYLASGAAVGAVVLGVMGGLVSLVNATVGPMAPLIALTLLVLPLTGVPAARIERWRLRLVDSEPPHDPHQDAPGPGFRAWLRTRLREPATWREIWFVSVCGIALWWIDAAMVFLVFYAPIAWVVFTETEPPALAGTVAFLVMSPVFAYLVTAWASARAAITRAVLAPRDAELGERLVEVSRSRARLVDSFEVERRRIERDLHDGAQQRLVALTMTLGLARLDVPDTSPAAAQLDTAHRQAREALDELRELIRGVHPQVLTGRGLRAAVEDVAGRSALPVDVEIDLPRRLPAAVEITAYFIVCESLANASRHAKATSATVGGRLVDDVLVVEVSDDGGGGADPGRGTGLSGLADRVAVLDGRLLLSSPAGGPTVIRAELPCTQIDASV